MPTYFDNGTSGGTAVWNYWCNSTTTSSTATTCDPWFIWLDGTANSTSATCSTGIWSSWVTTTVSNCPPAPQRSAEQRAEDERRWKLEAEVQRKRAEEEKRKREAAEKRAQELLEANLVLEERDRFRAHGHIVVHGRSGQRYRVRKGRTHNIDVVDREGVIVENACVHVRDYVPDYDNMLAQKLMLEDDDEALMKVANRSPRAREAPVLPTMH